MSRVEVTVTALESYVKLDISVVDESVVDTFKTPPVAAFMSTVAPTPAVLCRKIRPLKVSASVGKILPPTCETTP